MCAVVEIMGGAVSCTLSPELVVDEILGHGQCPLGTGLVRRRACPSRVLLNDWLQRQVHAGNCPESLPGESVE